MDRIRDLGAARPWLTAIALLGVAVALWWVLTGRGIDRPPRAEEALPRASDAMELRETTGPGNVEEAPVEPGVVGAAAEDLARPEDDGDPGRSEQAAPLLVLRIEGSDGRPVVGARASWSALEGGLEDVHAGTVAVLSTASGDVRFRQAPVARDAASVLWILHPDHGARSVEVEAADGAFRVPAVVVLERRRGMEVEVVDREGAPRPGSKLVAEALPVVSRPSDSFENRARRVFRGEWTADRDGRARLPWFEGAWRIVAGDGSAVARPWIGEARDSLRLELRDGFSAFGTITGVPIPSDGHVECWLEEASGRRLLARCVPGADTGWELPHLPRVERAAYAFRLEMAGLVPDEVVLRPEPDQDTIQVDLVARKGGELWAYVTDDITGEELEQASVQARWGRDRRGAFVEGVHDHDGYFHLGGVPYGPIELVGRCDGYAEFVTETIEIREGQVRTRALSLRPAASVGGRVLWNDAPVEDFTISVERVDGTLAEPQSFRGREDGSFELTLPDNAGYVGLQAVTSGGVPTESVRAVLGDRDVILRVTGGLRGRGRLVDDASGQGVAGVRVQAYTASSSGRPGIPVGPAVHSGADGGFTFDVVPRGAAFVVIEDEDYSRLEKKVFTPADRDEADFGTIHLVPRQDFLVRLIGPPEEDYSRFLLVLKGAELVPESPFPPEGVLTFPSLSSGEYQLYLFDTTLPPQDVEIFRVYLMLTPGEDWTLELPAAVERTLVVVAEPPAGEELPAGLWVLADLPTIEKAGVNAFAVVRNKRLDEDGAAIFEHVPSGAGNLNLVNPEGRSLARVPVQIGAEESETFVTIPIESRVLTIQVVDSAGDPLPNVLVQVLLVGQSYGASGTTDPRGEARITGLQKGTYRVGLFHNDLGSRTAIPLEIVQSEQVARFVLEASAGVVLVLHDGPLPLAGVECRLADETGGVTLRRARSDASGEVRWEGLALGDYELTIDDPRVWPYRGLVSATAEPVPAPLELRRRGDLDVRFASGGASAVGGLSLGITPVDLAGEVAQWVSAGLVTAAPGPGLAADAAGRLSLGGLPHGAYRWSVTLADGSRLEGTVVVPAEDRGRLVIAVP